MNKAQTAEREEYIARLREIVKPGDTIFTTLRHVSRSGMQRKIGVWMFTCEDGRPVKRFLSYWTAKVTGYRFDDATETVSIGGCGMDMGFAIVHDLGRVLFPDGFGLAMKHGVIHQTKTPKTKAEAEKWYRQGYRSRGRNGDESGWDNDGGYALRHEWL